MSVGHALLIALVGFVAGGLNTIVGSGTLITFPVLLGLGYPAVVANVSNKIGLVPGGVSGTVGYRRELRGQGERALGLVAVAVAGGVVGAIALLELPAGSFRAVVPALILLAVALVVVGPYLKRRLATRGEPTPLRRGAILTGLFLAAVYGGYFGAGQGVLYISALGILIEDSLQRLNALKNAFAATVTAVAAIVFAITADVNWPVAGLLALGALVGGQAGAWVGRRMNPLIFRLVIVVIGLLAAIRLLV